MASSSNQKRMRLSKITKGYLYNNEEAIKAYLNYVVYGKVHPGNFAIFSDFPSYNVEVLFESNGIRNLVDNTLNDFMCYPTLVKMFYANLFRGFYDGNDNEVWSSVKGVQIILNAEILGAILECKCTGEDLSKFEIKENDFETFHEIFEGEMDFKNKNFRPKAKIVNLILQKTITPRSGNFNNPTSKVCKALFAIFGNYDINWAQVILDELRPKNVLSGENALFHGIYLTRIFNYFGVDLRGEECVPRKVFDKSNISLMKIPRVFRTYETYAEKVAHEERVEDSEEGEGMEIEEEEEEENNETSLESLEETSRPSNKILLQNQKIIVKNQKALKKSLNSMSSNMNKFFSKVSKKFNLSSSSSSSSTF